MVKFKDKTETHTHPHFNDVVMEIWPVLCSIREELLNTLIEAKSLQFLKFKNFSHFKLFYDFPS